MRIRSFATLLVAVAFVGAAFVFYRARLSPTAPIRFRIEPMDPNRLAQSEPAGFGPAVESARVDRARFGNDESAVTVADYADQPLQGACIEAADGQVLARTDANGVAVFAPSDALLVASHPASMNCAFYLVELPRSSDGMRRLKLSSAAVVAGSVVDGAGGAVAGCRVVCVRGGAAESAPAASRPGAFLPNARSVRTASDGTFSFACVPGRRYEVYVSDEFVVASGAQRTLQVSPPAEGLVLTVRRIYAAAVRVRYQGLPSSVVYDTFGIWYGVPNGFQSIEPMDNRALSGCEQVLRRRFSAESEGEALKFFLLVDRRSRAEGAVRVTVEANARVAAMQARPVELAFLPAHLLQEADVARFDEVGLGMPGTVAVDSPIQCDLLSGDGGFAASRIRPQTVVGGVATYVVPAGTYTVRPTFFSLLGPRWVRTVEVAPGASASVDLHAEGRRPSGSLEVRVVDATGAPASRFNLFCAAENDAEFLFQSDGERSGLTIETELQVVRLRLIGEGGRQVDRAEVTLTAEKPTQVVELRFGAE
jgi:hypothetical protein